MPTTYTPPNDNNPSSFTLPSDLDRANAESVNVALRALANKAAYTQATTPLLAAFNAFTRGQRITPPDDGESIITSDRVPDGDNRWACIISVPLETNRHLRMFQGGFSGVGRFILTVNAQWDIPTQQWSRDDNTGESSALIVATDYVSFHYQSPGSSPWSTWPTSTGGNGNIRCSGEFRYLQTKPRARTVPVSSATGGVSFSGADGSASAVVLGEHTFIRWALRVPPGAVLQYVRVSHYINTSASEVFRLTRRRATWDAFDPAMPAEEELVEVTSASSVGPHITEINAAGSYVDGYDEYCLQWEPSALLLNNVHAIMVEWLDPGPTPL